MPCDHRSPHPSSSATRGGPLAQLRRNCSEGAAARREKSTKKAAKAPCPRRQEDVGRYDDIEDIEADDDEREFDTREDQA